MGLEQRIARLERLEPVAGVPCPECGLTPPGFPLARPVRFVVDMPALRTNPPAAPSAEDTSRDHCRACGQRVVFRLEFDRNG